jgi:hypothetical protein
MGAQSGGQLRLYRRPISPQLNYYYLWTCNLGEKGAAETGSSQPLTGRFYLTEPAVPSGLYIRHIPRPANAPPVAGYRRHPPYRFVSLSRPLWLRLRVVHRFYLDLDGPCDWA